jgi:hypothetical protein
MKLLKDLFDGEVIHGKFEQKLRSQKGMYKNPDIEPPVSRKDKKPFDRFEVRKHKSGKSASIYGIRKNGYEEDVGSTTAEFADVLASAYNAGGYTSRDIQKIPLSDLFKK